MKHFEDPLWWHWDKNVTEAANQITRGTIKPKEIQELSGKFAEQGETEASINSALALWTARHRPSRWKKLLAILGIASASYTTASLIPRKDIPPTTQISNEQPAAKTFSSNQEFDTFVSEFVQKNYERLWKKWVEELGVGTIPKPEVELEASDQGFAARYDSENMKVLVRITGPKQLNLWVMAHQEYAAFSKFLKDTLFHEFGHHYAQVRSRALNIRFMRHALCDKEEIKRQCIVDEGIAESLNVLAQDKKSPYTSDDILDAYMDVYSRHEQGFRTVFPIIQEKGISAVDLILQNQPRPGEELRAYRERILSL